MICPACTQKLHCHACGYAPIGPANRWRQQQARKGRCTDCGVRVTEQRHDGRLYRRCASCRQAIRETRWYRAHRSKRLTPGR